MGKSLKLFLGSLASFSSAPQLSLRRSLACRPVQGLEELVLSGVGMPSFLPFYGSKKEDLSLPESTWIPRLLGATYRPGSGGFSLQFEE